MIARAGLGSAFEVPMKLGPGGWCSVVVVGTGGVRGVGLLGGRSSYRIVLAVDACLLILSPLVLTSDYGRFPDHQRPGRAS